MKNTLRRYTELPYVIDYMRTSNIVLLNPESWDDRNDSFYIEQYARRKSLESTYALCLTESPETYHHWRIFSHGSGGACIEFDKKLLLEYASEVEGLLYKEVDYKGIKDLKREEGPALEELPFLKRDMFQDEKEFRLFYGAKNTVGTVFKIEVPLLSVKKIILSPWLTESVATQVTKTLNDMEGCDNISVCRSDLVNNEKWKKLAIKA